MPDSPKIFSKIISQIDEKPIAVFDLDSTLYNVSHRTQKIVEDFSQLSTFQKKYPELVEQLKSVMVHHTDWGLKESLMRAKIQAPNDFYKSLKEFWQKHFFSSEYLKHDVPYEGAAEYVNALHENGVQIQYLTGRDELNMLRGTLESLAKHNFPLKNPEKQLFMKPIKGSSEDEDFKSEKLKIINQMSANIWFFENEPVIINKVMVHHPHIKLVWVDTTHSRRESPPEEIFKVRNRWDFKR